MKDITLGMHSILNMPAMGTQYAHELKDVDCDPRLKQCIYRLGNDVHEVAKRLNETNELILILAEAINAVGQMNISVVNKAYKKQNG